MVHIWRRNPDEVRGSGLSTFASIIKVTLESARLDLVLFGFNYLQEQDVDLHYEVVAQFFWTYDSAPAQCDMIALLTVFHRECNWFMHCP